MALRILNFEGEDIVANPPALNAVNADTVAGGKVQIQCKVIEDGALPVGYLSATLNWSDGHTPIVYNGTSAGTIIIDTYKILSPGDYWISVTGQNYRAPEPQFISTIFPFRVVSPGDKQPKEALIYGPILPKDTGYPNTTQWNWQRGEDIEILASSIKMLLITRKGERVMQPEYGTNLRAILFELGTTGVEGLVQQEIVQALNLWEPRVALSALSVQKTDERDVTINAIFVSKLNQQNFDLSVTFSF